MKKLEVKGLEGADLEFANQQNEIIDALEAKRIEVSELKSKIDTIEKLEVKSYDKELLEMKNALLTFEAEIAKKGARTMETKSLNQLIVDEIKSLGVNNVAELNSYLEKNGTKTLEIKAIAAVDTGDNTDTIGRTNLDMQIAWSPVRKNAFLGEFRTVSEASGKSKFGYMEGSYTGAAAYVGEGVGNPDSDAASASAAFMEYAKLQSILSVNTEVYEDLPDFANGLIAQMQIAMSKKVDDEAYVGDGLAPGGVQHIKGLNTYATAVSFAGNMLAYAASVKAANVSDLAGAIKSYIDNLDGSYVADKVWMNPVDFFKMAHLKDTTNQPLITRDAFGNPTLAGLMIKTSAKVTANTMLIMDSNVGEWRTKRTMQLKMGQFLPYDVTNDKQSAVLMARYQFLVRTADQKAVMKVTDIAAAVLALTAA